MKLIFTVTSILIFCSGKPTGPHSYCDEKKYKPQCDLMKICSTNPASPGCFGLEASSLSPLQIAEARRADDLLEKIDDWYQDFDEGLYFTLIYIVNVYVIRSHLSLLYIIID